MVPTLPTFSIIAGEPVSTANSFMPTIVKTTAPTQTPSFLRTSMPSTIPTTKPSSSVPTLNPTVIDTQNPTITPTTKPDVVSKLSNSGTTSTIQNSSSTIIIVVVSIVVVIIMMAACYCVTKKTSIKQLDAYQKWTSHYENKSAKKQNPPINESTDDMYRIYSKTNSLTSQNTTFSPYVSTRQSVRNSMRGQTNLYSI